MEAVSSSGIVANIYPTTLGNVLEDSHLQLLTKLTDFRHTCYKYHAIKGKPILIFNFLSQLINLFRKSQS
jgi:hypothetical protein